MLEHIRPHNTMSISFSDNKVEEKVKVNKILCWNNTSVANIVMWVASKQTFSYVLCKTCWKA